MSAFLFLKQIVDMLYQFKILDYGMVIFAIVLLVYKVYTDKLYINVRSWFCGTDYIVMALMLVYLLSFARYTQAYGIFFKVESCFLIYFLGRVYGEGILRYGRVMALAGYLIIYLNLIYRFYQFGYTFILTGPAITLINEGGLYYYKTDMAIGMIVATLFIYMFSEKKILKWITVIPVAGYMVFYSGARMEKVILAVEYVMIFLYEMEKRTHFLLCWKKKYVQRIMLVLGILIAGGFAVLQIFPFDIIAAQSDIETGLGSVIENLMHSRHIIWWDILRYFSDQPLLTRLTGIDLITECLHNAAGQRAHSTYIKLIYATGYLGCGLWYILITSMLSKVTLKENRKLVYMVFIMWVMFLVAGLSIESMESTQMSWFPMLYAGALVGAKEMKGSEQNGAV